MNDRQKIESILEKLNRNGFAGGKAADCWESIARIALERFAMEHDAMGNDYGREVRNLCEDINECCL